MTAAKRTMVLSPWNNQLEINLSFYGTIDRFPKTWPASAAVIFGIAVEQRQPATDTGIGTGQLGHAVLTGEWTLGAMLAGHQILFRRQLRLPFLIGFANLLDRF